MSLSENLESFGIPGTDFTSALEEEIHQQCIEMGQLKTDFDIQKYTIASKGPFIASQFHMLMRQYGLCKYELKRMAYDREELNRRIEDYEDQLQTNKSKMITVWTDKGMQEKYLDLEILKLKNQVQLQEIEFTNK